MKPLPKWMGFLGLLAVLIPIGIHAYQTGEFGTAISAGIGAITAFLAHSATGTGGQAQPA